MSEYTEAQIATVKELLAEAKAIGDVIGEYTYTSRLQQLEEEG